MHAANPGVKYKMKNSYAPLTWSD